MFMKPYLRKSALLTVPITMVALLAATATASPQPPTSRGPAGTTADSVSAMTLSASADRPAGRPAGRGEKPTVVLVHGAFADASGWNDVTDAPAVATATPSTRPPTRCAA